MNKTNVTQGNKEKGQKSNKKNKKQTNKKNNTPSRRNLPKADLSFGSDKGSRGGRGSKGSRGSGKSSNNTPKQDQIAQANKSYNDTMMELNGKLKDSMITQKEYDEKKKSALESLIDAYYKQGKTISNSHELDAKVKELGDVKFAIQHNDAINEANKEFADAINSATKQYVNNLSTYDELSRQLADAIILLSKNTQIR